VRRRGARHQAAVDQALLDGVAQQLDHHHLGQAIHHGVVAATRVEGLAEQQLLREVQPGQASERHQQPGGQRTQQGVLVAEAELDRGAHQLGALCGLGIQAVGGRPREEQHARLVEHRAAAPGIGNAEGAAAQQVQMADTLPGVEAGHAAQRTAVKNPGTQVESLLHVAHLLELGRLQPEFDKRGVKVIALSSDGRDRAQAMADKLKAPDLRMGYDLGLAHAREWGLYISTSRGVTSIGIEEPALFSEPGVFLARPDGTLFYGAVQTMPFARPHFDELLAAIDFALAKSYPARGEYAGAV
jgi:hypothetical protein